jgi:hypothetical protein
MTTVKEFFAGLAYDLEEFDELLLTGFVSQDDALNAVNHAQNDFINMTGCIKLDDSRTATVGLSTYTRHHLATDIDRISYRGKRIYRATSWDLDREDPSWSTKSGNPKQFHEDHLGLNQYQFDRLPTTAGTIRVISDLLPTQVVSLQDNMTVPDVWLPYIGWEVLAVVLSKSGENQDLERSQYAHRRYQIGVMLAKQLMDGTPIPFDELMKEPA